MSVYDRDYMRPEGRARPTAPLTWTLRIIITNVVVYLGCAMLPGPQTQRDFLDFLQLSVENLASGRIWTILTAAFMHLGPMHLLWNMLALWFFGTPVEAELGPQRYLRFYLLSAMLAFVPFLLSEGAQGALATSTLGASGAVMAVLIYRAFRAPNARVILFIFPMRLWVLAAIAVTLDFLSLGGRDGVNHWAHLGGAALGFLEFRYAFPSRIVDKLPAALRGGGAAAPRARPHARPPTPSPSSTTTTPRPGPRTDAERDRVDELLGKISDQGIGSLTEEEKTFLKRASKGYH